MSWTLSTDSTIQSMTFSSGLRFTASSILRHRRSRFSVPATLKRFTLLQPVVPDSRFLYSSTSSPRPRLPRGLRPARARKRDDKELEEDAGNGAVGVMLIDKNVDEGRVVATELHKEATDAYMSYAMSVLLGRALPDVRDGLKPVHRRILYAMHELGLSSRKPYKKCARVVGEVLGKFHPHGDSAVYDSLVRMAQAEVAGLYHSDVASDARVLGYVFHSFLYRPQDFSLRSPLIRGHGNFGSIDADPAAAMRYTECRLEALTEAMLLADLDQDTVDFVPNFDNSQKEPSVLPARLPTLLLNGASGIAVGMATNIPPHNLEELTDVLCALIHNPDATLQELLEYMPGPDFPTGGVIMGNLGILDAYRTGRGRVVVRGKTDVELIDSRSKREAIIIKEIPYQINKASLVEKIAELVESKTIDGISDIRDESDRSGMRIVIEVKRGSDSAVVLNNLYRLTSLQSSFSCNMVGRSELPVLGELRLDLLRIHEGQPKLMGLKDLLQAFIDFRCSIIERRAKFNLTKAQDRRHIIEGIVIGLDNLDGVIHTIREASSNSVALTKLRTEFNLSEKQAEAILDIHLRKLTVLERKKFVDEMKSLEDQISRLEELLSSKKEILHVIEKEAKELRDRFSTPRRSMLEDTDCGQLDEIDVIPNEEILLAISEKGYVKRMQPSTFNLQHRGTIGKSVGKLRVNDSLSDFIVCRTHDHILYFSDRGIVHSARAFKIPECTRTAAGTPLIQILSLSEGERITSVIPVSEFTENQYLLMLTINGYVKKVSLSSFSSIRSSGIIAIQLGSGDELKWVRSCANDDLVAMGSHAGSVIVSPCDRIRALGRNTRGSIAMRLREDDKMACMDIIPAAMHKELERHDHNPLAKSHEGPWLLFVSESGHGKRVPLNSFNLSRLNRMGVKGYKFSSGEDRLAAVFVTGFSRAEDGESDEQVVLVSQTGTVNRIKVRDIPVQSRYARGVILMRLDHGSKIQSCSLISATETKLDDSDSDSDSEPQKVAG